MEVVAVVPARGGSKGIPRKNLARLGGHSLTALAVRCALRAGIRRVLVSTDDPEIAREGRAAGAEVPALRPPELSGDDAPTAEAVLHALEAAAARPDAVMLLQPTSPLRRASDLTDALALLEQEPDAPGVVSVTRLLEPHPAKVMRIEGGRLAPFVEEPAERPRQALSEAYRFNGVVYLVRAAALRETRRVILPRSLPLVIPEERALNLDHRWDLILAEALLERGAAALEIG